MNELREEIELPKLEWREMLAYEPVRCIEETCALEHAGEYEIRAEREAQLKSSLAANREQKAEIERLKKIEAIHNEGMDILFSQEPGLCRNMIRHEYIEDCLYCVIDSLRASVGEKPEDAYKRGQEHMRDIIGAALRLGDMPRRALLCDGLEPFRYAPPVLPGEEK